MRLAMAGPALIRLMIRLAGERLKAAPELTVTSVLAGANPEAVAVMVADPILPPVTFG